MKSWLVLGKDEGITLWRIMLFRCLQGIFLLFCLALATGIKAQDEASRDATAVDASQSVPFKMTIAQMLKVGSAMQAWREANEGVDAMGPGAEKNGMARSWSFSTTDQESSKRLEVISFERLTELLVPQYLESVPENDGWGHPYEYAVNGDPREGVAFGIRSSGADGEFGTDRYQKGSFLDTDLAQDLVWVNDVFIRIPASLRAAIESARVKQTVAQMRMIGSAMEAWLEAQGESEHREPQPSESRVGESWGFYNSNPENLNGLESISFKRIEALLVPKYIEWIPETDGWGYPYQFALNDDQAASVSLGIRSPGRDGAFATHSYKTGAFSPSDFDQDMVWVDGYFIRWPDLKAADEKE